ncbi:MAG: hypothetical protein HOP13_20955 [Alphaproteobacteria bacterium]|nr:hypothetical protein [Alphaproteobacteria bacterium]
MRWLILSVAALFLAGCDQPRTSSSSAVPGEHAGAGNNIQQLGQKLDEMDTEIVFLKSRVDSLEGSTAYVTPEPNYSMARNQFGAFPVMYGRASAYLDGHKVFLEIGNPTLMTFNGAKLSVKYGPPMPRLSDGKIDWNRYKSWQESQKTYETTVTNDFRPGWYTRVELTITPSKPEEVRELRVAVNFDSIALQRPQ